MLVPTELVMKPCREPQYPGAAGGSGSSPASGGRKTLSRVAANETDHPACAMRRQLQPRQSPRPHPWLFPVFWSWQLDVTAKRWSLSGPCKKCRCDEEAVETGVQQGREADE